MEKAKELVDGFSKQEAQKIQVFIGKCVKRRNDISDALYIIHSTRCSTSYSTLEKEYIELGHLIESAKRDLHDILNKEDK